MGSPDKRQIDGLGGAHPLTSKVGIVRRGSKPGRRPRLPVRAAAAGQGHRRHDAQLRQHARGGRAVRARDRLVTPQGDDQHVPRADAQHRHAVRHHRADARRATSSTQGDARIDGVPGTAAPITINFLDTAGSVCAGLLPTGHVRDGSTASTGHLHRQRHAARDVPRGRRRPHRLRERRRAERRHRAEDPASKRLRIACGHAMGLGDVDAEELSEDDADRAAARTAAASPRAASSRTSATTRSACSPP